MFEARAATAAQHLRWAPAAARDSNICRRQLAICTANIVNNQPTGRVANAIICHRAVWVSA